MSAYSFLRLAKPSHFYLLSTFTGSNLQDVNTGKGVSVIKPIALPERGPVTGEASSHGKSCLSARQSVGSLQQWPLACLKGTQVASAFCLSGRLSNLVPFCFASFWQRIPQNMTARVRITAAMLQPWPETLFGDAGHGAEARERTGGHHM